jgi:hypothetical protein
MLVRRRLQQSAPPSVVPGHYWFVAISLIPGDLVWPDLVSWGWTVDLAWPSVPGWQGCGSSR